MENMRLSWLILLFAFFYCNIFAQQHKNVLPSEVCRWYSQYVTFLPYDRLDSVLVYAQTDLVPVIYKVNKYDLHVTAQLDSLVSLINHIKHDDRVGLAYVWVGGSASPEGPVRWNKKLGDYRSRQLADYLLEHTDLTSSKFRVENLKEDWYSLSRTLEKSDYKYKDTLLNIISHEPDLNRRKERIRALDGGRTWRWLIRELFPSYRNARVVIVCYAEQIRLPAIRPCPPVLNFASLPKDIKPIAVHQIPSKRFFALKTNGLFALALVANLGFEVELWEKWSLDVPVYYSPYDITPTRKLRLLAIQPEVRRWMRKAGEGHYVGVHTHVAGFNVAINDNGRYQDPNHALWGLGIGYGYAMNLGQKKRWGLEFNLGVGFAEYDYDVYRNWQNGPKYHSGSDWYWGLTRAGVTVSYKWYKSRKNR